MQRQRESRIFLLNGPNLNLLGTRQPEIYGSTTLQDVEAQLVQIAHPTTIVFRQSNHEGQLVDWIQECRLSADGLILNAGAFTHTSLAIHDALLTLDIPIIELHVSNPHVRETFRHHSFVGAVAKREIAGFGAYGYILAVQAALHLLG